jgi:uncharacterized SAM-binding protein YcdF (DUF218 family)
MISRMRRYPGLKRRLALVIGFGAVSAYVLGLVAFIGTLESRRSVAKNADAIVALTGGGARLNGAVKLLADGRGRRLLISGVHEDVTREQLFEQAGGPREMFDCCVDLGRGAGNTIGNAYEAAAWARKQGYRSLILVTAAYHMPRSQMELAAAMPDVKLIPQPVFPEDLDTKGWWNDRQSAWVLVGEYTKYLTAWVRLHAVEPLGVTFRPGEQDRIDYGAAQPGEEPSRALDPQR